MLTVSINDLEPRVNNHASAQTSRIINYATLRNITCTNTFYHFFVFDIALFTNNHVARSNLNS